MVCFLCDRNEDLRAVTGVFSFLVIVGCCCCFRAGTSALHCRASACLPIIALLQCCAARRGGFEILILISAVCPRQTIVDFRTILDLSEHPLYFNLTFYLWALMVLPRGCQFKLVLGHTKGVSFGELNLGAGARRTLKVVCVFVNTVQS